MTTLLQVMGLSKSFGAVNAVNGIHFSITEGHCAALLGPNGAGKTTTIRMIAGLLRQTAGQLIFEGKEPGGKHRELIGYLPQTPSFYNWMTGLEFVVYAGRLSGLSSAAARKNALALVERVGLAGAAKRRIGSYSGGMKQRLGLAQALTHQPKLLILDEPVSALDPLGRREVLELLHELKQETTILFSTHVLHDAEELCDDVIIMRSGQVALQGPLEEIRRKHRKLTMELQIENDAASREWLSSYIHNVQQEIDSSNLSCLFEAAEQHQVGARFTVKDSDAARRHLVEALARHQVKVTKLELGHSSLEDLFMEVVST
ncbi:ABC transporter ATP-binding protein [Paenibacillus sinopodophylli]|uniref:ABC transporter ATP-binding protein n=1 Tax=Paenibacillus sinopodophylli TaxID=1837342 RepID=UPI00110CB1C7|nr:ABC transporter ATP-binding protein [Paenibacillus sinopodophylli]